MKLLNRYILSQYIRQFVTVAVALTALYLLVDFIEKFDNFTQAGKSLSLALKYFSFNIPFIVDQLGPVLILLSGVISLGLLNHNNELRALKAGGIPLKLIVRPLLWGGLACTLIAICAAQWLLPHTISSTNEIWYEQVQGKVPLGIFRNGRYYFKGKEGFYSFEWPNPKVYAFKNFSYSRWNQAFGVGALVAAKWASWNEEIKRWELGEAQMQEERPDGGFRIVNMPTWQVQLPESPGDFLIPLNESAELSLTGLYREISHKESDEQKAKAWADFLGRISYLFLGMPLLLLGLPILMLACQRWGRDLSVAIPASCGLAFVAWGIWGAMQSMAGAGYLNPIVAAVAVHILFASLGIWLLRRQDQ
ncbi:MAG: LptF/LptG family permease [Desulfobulbaceae bacterium]|jgi:lipopolysaccharide export system permease protein|nr:LptF/LptG family permease [Desulfobulbaceae bacterium]